MDDFNAEMIDRRLLRECRESVVGSLCPTNYDIWEEVVTWGKFSPALKVYLETFRPFRIVDSYEKLFKWVMSKPNQMKKIKDIDYIDYETLLSMLHIIEENVNSSLGFKLSSRNLNGWPWSKYLEWAMFSPPFLKYLENFGSDGGSFSRPIRNINDLTRFILSRKSEMEKIKNSKCSDDIDYETLEETLTIIDQKHFSIGNSLSTISTHSQKSNDVLRHYNDNNQQSIQLAQQSLQLSDLKLNTSSMHNNQSTNLYNNSSDQICHEKLDEKTCAQFSPAFDDVYTEKEITSYNSSFPCNNILSDQEFNTETFNTLASILSDLNDDQGGLTNVVNDDNNNLNAIAKELQIDNISDETVTSINNFLSEFDMDVASINYHEKAEETNNDKSDEPNAVSQESQHLVVFNKQSIDITLKRWKQLHPLEKWTQVELPVRFKGLKEDYKDIQRFKKVNGKTKAINQDYKRSPAFALIKQSAFNYLKKSETQNYEGLIDRCARDDHCNGCTFWVRRRLKFDKEDDSTFEYVLEQIGVHVELSSVSKNNFKSC